MKHQNKDRKFKRDRKQRKALMKTMLGSLIMQEKITTTLAKAKELKRFIDPIIKKAKSMTKDEKHKVAVIRELNNIIPVMAVKKVSGEFIKRFSKRNSGYTRVIKLASRKSDNAEMAVIEFID